ncbi:MAG: hypothetical protein ACRDX9_09620 [Acidimicrobiia bacterium]
MPLRTSRFDAEGPGLAGPLGLVVVLVAVLVATPELPARAHGGAFEVVVEAVNRSEDPTQLAYGIVLTFVDGHEVAGAAVTLTAASDGDARAEAVATETTPGVYIADLTLEPGSWRVTVGVEGDDAEGTVEFSEEVGDTALVRPVVRVDTADPDRQGSVVTDSSVFGPPPSSAPETETELDVRVEALVRDPVAPLIVEYGVIPGATEGEVSLSAVSDRELTIGPVSLDRLAPGVFQTTVEYPEAGTWEVTVQVGGADGGQVTFGESLPWPHYTTEAGSPKIKVDSSDQAAEGSLIEIGESPIFGIAVGGTAPTTSTTPPGPSEGAGEVVVSIPSSGSEIAFQVLLRWLHLIGIGVWAASIGVIGLRQRRGFWPGLAIAGMIGTVATGVTLALWGAPTPFPGIFSWAELGDRSFGPTYRWAFLVKMVFVLTGIVATAFLVARTTRLRMAVTAAGLLGALGAVVVMSQLHLFAHL